MPLALAFLRTDITAHQGKRIVGKEQFARLLDFTLLQQRDGAAYIRADGAPLRALGVAALQTSSCFIDNMIAHCFIFLPFLSDGNTIAHFFLKVNCNYNTIFIANRFLFLFFLKRRRSGVGAAAHRKHPPASP